MDSIKRCNNSGIVIYQLMWRLYSAVFFQDRLSPIQFLLQHKDKKMRRICRQTSRCIEMVIN
jgi:hypothetical protein